MCLWTVCIISSHGFVLVFANCIQQLHSQHEKSNRDTAAAKKLMELFCWFNSIWTCLSALKHQDTKVKDSSSDMLFFSGKRSRFYYEFSLMLDLDSWYLTPEMKQSLCTLPQTPCTLECAQVWRLCVCVCVSDLWTVGSLRWDSWVTLYGRRRWSAPPSLHSSPTETRSADCRRPAEKTHGANVIIHLDLIWVNQSASLGPAQLSSIIFSIQGGALQGLDEKLLIESSEHVEEDLLVLWLKCQKI